MRLSTRVRYATRALVDLALHSVQPTVMLRQIAERQNVSGSYLENLMVVLKAAGLVRSMRGRGGGYSLAKPAREIKLSSIVAALEGPISLVECVDNPELCPRSSFCVTRDVWAEIGQAITSVLDSWTLEDLAKRASQEGQPGLPPQLPYPCR